MPFGGNGKWIMLKNLDRGVSSVDLAELLDGKRLIYAGVSIEDDTCEVVNVEDEIV